MGERGTGLVRQKQGSFGGAQQSFLGAEGAEKQDCGGASRLDPSPRPASGSLQESRAGGCKQPSSPSWTSSSLLLPGGLGTRQPGAQLSEGQMY